MAKSNSPAPLGINVSSGVGVEAAVGSETQKVLELKRKAEQKIKDTINNFIEQSGMQIGAVTFEHNPDKVLVKVRLHLAGEDA